MGDRSANMPTSVIHITAASEFVRLVMRPEITRLGDGLAQSVVASPGADLDGLTEIGIRVYPVTIKRKLTPFSDLVSLARLIALLRRERPELIHTYTPKAGLLGQLAGLMTGVPCRVHSNRGLLHRHGGSSARRTLFRLVDKITCRIAHRVLFVSRSDRDYLVSEGLCPRAKGIHVGGGVDLTRFRRSAGEGRGALRKTLGYRDHDIVILTVGRFVVDKGYLDLAKAIPMMKSPIDNVRFLWVAPVMGGEQGALSLDMLDHPVLTSVVQRLERRDDLPELYQAADLLIHPSHREGAPQVLMEAAAMGLPILASNIEGNREVVDFGRTAIGFEPNNPADLAATLDRALRDRAALGAMADAARQEVVARFDLETLGPRIRAAYDELLEHDPLAGWSYRGKRAFDLLVVGLAAIPALAIALVVALAVLVFLGRPIFFVQERPGHRGRPFRLLKFRTMRAPKPDQPSDDGERLTAFGRWLRSTSLDELPELLNVARGEMSLVGPRPLLMEYLPLYDAEQARRMEVRPGITGWAQIKGRNEVPWRERLALDAWYVDHATFRLDLEILVKTIGRVVRREGIAQSGHPTVEKFRGNDQLAETK